MESHLDPIITLSRHKRWPWGLPPSYRKRHLISPDKNGISPPLISIVIPTLNGDRFLEEAIRSVLLQSYPFYELIIVDGGSSDRSISIIKKYNKWIAHWISEPDEGQSHAINKGIRLCNGEIFNWLNSDDILLPHAFFHIAKAWDSSPNTLICGNVCDVRDSKPYRIVRQKNIKSENFLDIKAARSDQMTWHQPGIFFPLQEVTRLGGLDQSLHYTMDYDLISKVLLNTSVTYIPYLIAKFRVHPASKTVSKGPLAFRLELIQHLQRNPEMTSISSSELAIEEVSLRLGQIIFEKPLSILHKSYLVLPLLIKKPRIVIRYFILLLFR